MQITVVATGSSGNFYIIQAGEEKLLLECGITWKNILKGLDFNLNNIVGCLVSHVHHDHNKAIKDVIKNGIDVYATKETFEGIEGNRVRYISPQKSFKAGSFTILPFKSQHDCDGSLGFLIQHGEEKLLFLTDSYYCKYKFKELTHVMIECNYSEDILPELHHYDVRLLKSHMSLETCIKTLQAWDLSNTKDIVLIHMSKRHGDENRFRKEVEKATGIRTYVAKEGLII